MNPLYSIGVLLSFGAMMGFLLFLRGFLLGLAQIFYIDSHEEHIGHARVRIVWGVMVMNAMFLLWVIIRGFATMIGFDTADGHKTTTVLFTYTIIIILFYFMDFFKKEDGH